MTNNETQSVETTEPTTKPESELEMAKAEMTVKKVQEVLQENGMEIQVILAGYPFMIRPEVRIVPKREEAHEEVKVTS